MVSGTGRDIACVIMCCEYCLNLFQVLFVECLYLFQVLRIRRTTSLTTNSRPRLMTYTTCFNPT